MLGAAAGLLLLVAQTQASITPIPSKTFPHTAVLDGSRNVHLFWEFNSNDIVFELHVGTKGWLALGVSPNGGMSGADIALGWLDNNQQPQLFDTFASGQTQPIADQSQDLTLIGGGSYSNVTRLTWQRSLLSCDSNHDLDITDGTVRLIYAYGSVAPASYSGVSYHGLGQRGSRSLRLLEPSATAQPHPPGTTTHRFLNANYTIPTAGTTYWCHTFRFPSLTTKNHVIEVNPVIQPGNEGMVHHILMYRCYGNVNVSYAGTGAQCYTGAMPTALKACFNVFAAWAIGGGKFILPSHVGYPVGPGHGPDLLIMETHFDNPGGISGRKDNSGLEIVMTTQLRSQEAGFMEVGEVVHKFSLVVPPHYPSFNSRGSCSSTCLRQELQAPMKMNVFASLLHSHLLGRELYARVIRNGQEVANLGSDRHYDFNLQEARLFSKEVEVLPGDDIVVDCQYDSTGRSNITEGGLSTTNEMCLAYLIYYPAINITRCLSGISPLDTMYNYIGATSFNFRSTTITAPAHLSGLNLISAMNTFNWSAAAQRDHFRKFYENPSTTRFYLCESGGVDLLMLGGIPHAAAQGSILLQAPVTASCSGSPSVGSISSLDFTVLVLLLLSSVLSAQAS